MTPSNRNERRRPMIRPISYIYVDIVKRVAQGMAREDAEEFVRGVGAIRAHERFTTHLLGSAWLCYYVMLTRLWAPAALEVLLEQSPTVYVVWDYERVLAAGSIAHALNVWKVCTRGLGVEHALARPSATEPADDVIPDVPIPWRAIAASLALASVWYAAWHGVHGVSAALVVPFYLIGGGTGSADINAGSSIGAAQAAPATGGSWTNATNTFVATGGTPFGTTVAGDYVSVYPDGNTVTGYTAQVVTVVSNVSVILSTTIKYGTAPTDGAANRSAVAGGSWNTEQPLAAGGLATTTVPQPTKINIKGNLTLTTNRTISLAAATTTLLWFSSYNTTPGDLDTDTTNSLAKPIWTLNATFLLTTSGAYQIWTGPSVVGSRSGSIWAVGGGTNQQYIRCRSDNTSANVAAIAISYATNSIFTSYCWFRTPTTATTSGTVSMANSETFVGCVAEGGGIAGYNAAAIVLTCIHCIGVNNTGAAFLNSTSRLALYGCTAYAPTVDGAKWTGTPGASSHVIGLLCVGANGGAAVTNGINNASGTNTGNIVRVCNDYFNVTNTEVGMGDVPAFFGQIESVFPLVSSTDLTPLTTSNAYKNGFPKFFEGGGALGSQADGGLSTGAVQPTPTTPPIAHVTGARSIGTY